MTKIEEICRVFGIEGEYTRAETITNGNINNTYKATFLRDGQQKSYIAQRVNTYVFKNPVEIMKNISLVTSHIHQKVVEAGRSTRRNVLKFFTTAAGRNFYIDEDGNFWRVSRFITDSVAYQNSSDPDILRATGKAFGEFQMQLADFNASLLYETITDFHNTKKRLESFFEDVSDDSFNRVSEVLPEIEYISSVFSEASRLSELSDARKLPIRVTHNDTKADNVLFDVNTNEVLCVVDLDTVMPGLPMYDFGDAVRGACSSCAEDERDLSKVYLDLDRYRAFSEGFIGSTRHALTETELSLMADGAFTIAIELGTRFLHDYITGDKYFKTTHERHNLERARCQLALARDMHDKLGEMREIAAEIAAR